MDGAVLNGGTVTLRGPKPLAAKTKNFPPIFGFRCPPHLKAYLKTASASERRSMSEIIVFAVELERDINDMLGPLRPKLEEFALQAGLDRSRSNDMAKLFVALINKGLAAAEADSKKKK